MWSRFLFKAFIPYTLAIGFTGCGVHYYDHDVGIEHVWGIGHLKMKVAVPTEGVRATVAGVQLVGVGIGVGQTNYIQIGWSDRRLLRVLNSSTCVRLDWPSNDMFSIRVGTSPSHLMGTTDGAELIQEELCQ